MPRLAAVEASEAGDLLSNTCRYDDRRFKERMAKVELCWICAGLRLSSSPFSRKTPRRDLRPQLSNHPSLKSKEAKRSVDRNEVGIPCRWNPRKG